jgi:hypothetical protein
MSKALKNSNLTQRGATRALVAISLSFSLVAFGCTTDRNLGNGDPVTTPGLRTSPLGGASTGTESAPSVPPSMTSSSSIGSSQALPVVTFRNGLSRADQAAAIMAQHQPRERYLGPAFPGGYSGFDGSRTGQFQNPALRTNPQLTVNSSLSSGPVPVVASGAGDAGGVTAGDSIAAGAFIAGTDIGAGLATVDAGVAGTVATAGTTAAAPIFNTGTTGLSTTAATSLPTGTLAATVTPTTTPTAFSVIAPSPLVSTSPALAQAATSARAPSVALGSSINGTLIDGTDGNTGSTANLTNGQTAAASTTAATATGSTTANNGTTARLTAGAARTTVTSGVTAATTVSPNPVRITTVNGRRVITNVNTTARRNQ